MPVGVINEYPLVPVFDGRDFEFDLTDEIEQLSDNLPVFEGEIPSGSFVTIAYTVSTYPVQGTSRVSLNIQWALVIGTPDGY